MVSSARVEEESGSINPDTAVSKIKIQCNSGVNKDFCHIQLSGSIPSFSISCFFQELAVDIKSGTHFNAPSLSPTLSWTLEQEWTWGTKHLKIPKTPRHLKGPSLNVRVLKGTFCGQWEDT